MRIANPHLRQFCNHVAKLAARHHVEVRFIPKLAIKTAEGFAVSGYFQSEPGQLFVATGKPEKEWALVLAHEYCHMQQWIQGTRAWKRNMSRNGTDHAGVIESWLDNLCELTDWQKGVLFDSSIDLELECEKMTVRLLKKHRAFSQVNIPEYVKRANAYLYFYRYVSKNRKWYKSGKGPYQNETLWKRMPTTFQKDYGVFAYQRLYERFYEAVYGV